MDDPSTADTKMAANRKTLKEMGLLLKKGGNLIWVAPSGGRDRPLPDTDQWQPAEFDPSAVELMRRFSDDADVPGHLYPMALICYDIMPPPRTIEKELGEQRIIGFHGTAISVGPEANFQEVAGDIPEKKKAREVFSSAVYASVLSQYKVLDEAVKGGKGLSAATPELTLDQPWFEAGNEVVEEKEAAVAL